MPVISCHCFANHRGGVGKTTLAYQVSTAYAVAHPECKVLVIDTTNSGDVSEMLMGGIYEKRGREALRKLIPVANVTQLYLKALVASNSTPLAEVLKAHEESQHTEAVDGFEKRREQGDEVLSNVLQNMPVDERLSPLEKVKSSGIVNIEECAIPLKEVNSRLPSNMYLCPSGIELEQSIAFSETQRLDIITVLLNSFQSVSGKWKVFIDTDTDHHGENGAYATIGLGIADFLCIPLHADMSDWYGAQVLLHDLQVLCELHCSHAQVHLVLWNGLNVQFKQSCSTTAAGGRNKCTFVPTRAEQDICKTLGSLVFQEAQRMPNLFALYNRSKNSSEQFVGECCVCVRSFGVIGVASKDVGVPIACLKPGVFHGIHLSYTLNNDIIAHSRENLEEVVKAIDEADKILNPSKRRKEHLEIMKAKQLERRLGLPLSRKGAGRPKKKSPSSTGKKAGNIGSLSLFKIYGLRNKYSLRDRSKKMKNKLYLDFVDSSSTSTVHSMP